MSGTPSQQRKPYDAAPYASLRSGEAGPEPKSSASDDRALTAATSEFDAEAEKLRQLRLALWAAFEAGPAAGLPNTLIDLTIAYTNALRLQLNLKSLSSRTLTPRQRTALDPRLDGSATR